MRIPIAAICGLVQLVFAFPVDEEAALTSSSSDNFFLPRGVDLMNQQLDARNEGYSNSLSHQSPNPAEHTRSKLEARVTGNCLTMPDWANDISAGGYLGIHALVGIGHYTANEFCAAGNGGESCHHWVNGGTSIFEFVIIANAVRNGDVTKALGVLGQGFSAMANSVPAPEGNPVTDGINRASQDAIRDSSNAVKRSLPRSEHINIARTLHEAGFEFDTVEHVDVASLDQRKRSNDAPDLTHRMIVRGTKVNNDIHDLTVNHYSDGHSSISLRASNETLSDDGSELSKRGTSVDLGLKLSFTFPGKMKMNDKSQRKALAHGLAKHWSETAFSQTGWGDYYGLIKDTNKNPMIKFRLSVENGKPDTDADDVFACGNMGFAVTGP